MPARHPVSKSRPSRRSPRSRILPLIAKWHSLIAQSVELSHRRDALEASLPSWASTSEAAICLEPGRRELFASRITEKNVSRIFGGAWRGDAPQLRRLRDAARAELAARKAAIAAERARLGIDQLAASEEKLDLRIVALNDTLEAADPATPQEATALCQWMLHRIGVNTIEDQTLMVDRDCLRLLQKWLEPKKTLD